MVSLAWLAYSSAFSITGAAAVVALSMVSSANFSAFSKYGAEVSFTFSKDSSANLMALSIWGAAASFTSSKVDYASFAKSDADSFADPNRFLKNDVTPMVFYS